MGILQRKIDEIRQKPEHIRLRYAWMWTAVVMIFILLIWVASFNSAKEEDSQVNPSFVQPEVLNQLQEGKKSLQDTTDQIKGTLQGLDQRVPPSQNLDNTRDTSEGFGQE